MGLAVLILILVLTDEGGNIHIHIIDLFSLTNHVLQLMNVLCCHRLLHRAFSTGQLLQLGGLLLTLIIVLPVAIVCLVRLFASKDQRGLLFAIGNWGLLRVVCLWAVRQQRGSTTLVFLVKMSVLV